ncbi:MAG: GNAT family N-acetyltransferase [Clostridia bacterium]|nr:GNAT family N-acetyltransferase [Clostridia bacterium]
MIVSPKIIKLKNGREAYVRSPALSEISLIYSFISRIYDESEYMLRTPEEVKRYTVDAGRKALEIINSSPCDCLLMCLIGDEPVGMCKVSYGHLVKIRHRGTISIGVRREYWGQGIGRKLMELQIALAKELSGPLQLELDYIDGNERAGNLYRSLGFTVTGRKPNAVRQPDGRLLDEYSMVLKLR